ncbi:AAA family ATPase [Thaumasiovibrio sp. DFM-14]|uniref:AAA family ATPase n=1 Tax=Thaumasiovibrio sp. DFM-14 TaxID=3384792 RepID=UPI00399FAF5B
MNNLKVIPSTGEQIKKPLAAKLSGLILSEGQSFISSLSSYISTWPNITLHCSADSHALNSTQIEHADFAIIDAELDWQQLVKHLYSCNPSINVILISKEAETSLMRQALKLGIKDVLVIPFDEHEIDEILRDIAIDKKQNTQLGRLCAVINSKGGMGATTIATTLAHMMALKNESSPVLVDTDSQFGCVADLLAAKPKYMLQDAIQQIEEIDDYALDGFLSLHESGLRFITNRQAHFMDDTPPLSANELYDFQLKLRQKYSDVILDMSRGLERHFSSMLHEAEFVFIVVQQTIPSLKEAAQLLKQLQYLGVRQEAIQIVINRYCKKENIDVKQIQQTLGLNKVFTVSNDYCSVTASADLAQPLASHFSKSYIIKDIQQLLDHIQGKKTSHKKSLWKMFSGKRR